MLPTIPHQNANLRSVRLPPPALYYKRSDIALDRHLHPDDQYKAAVEYARFAVRYPTMSPQYQIVNGTENLNVRPFLTERHFLLPIYPHPKLTRCPLSVLLMPEREPDSFSHQALFQPALLIFRRCFYAHTSAPE